jgi:hypothetical protein
MEEKMTKNGSEIFTDINYNWFRLENSRPLRIVELQIQGLSNSTPAANQT